MNVLKSIIAIILISFLSLSCGTTKKVNTPSGSAEVQSYKWYSAQKAMTIADLSVEYILNLEELRKLNPELKNTINAGQRIKLPLNAIKRSEKISTIVDTVKVPIDIEPIEKFPADLLPPKVYDVALLLPFNLDAASSLTGDGNFVLDGVSQICLDYYQGLLIAADSLKNAGFSANIKVFDTFSDSISISTFLNNPLMKSMDLVIGPAYSANLNKVAEFCNLNSIPFISPVSSSPGVTSGNPHAIQLIPSASNQVKLFTDFILKNYKRASMLILHSDSKLEKDLSEIFKLNLNSNSLIKPQLVEYGSAWLKSGEIESKLKLSSKNVIIIPSSDQAFVASTLAKLVDLSNKYDITVMGLPTWENFETIDFKKLDKLNVHYFVTSYVDFNDSKLNTVRMSYMKKYKTDPSVSAIQGYDAMLVFGKALLTHGREFMLTDFSNDASFFHNGISLKRNSTFDGYENMSIKILSFDKLVINAQTFYSNK